MRLKHTIRLPPELSARLADYARRKRVAQAHVVEAALAVHLSPDAAEQLEAALARRLDRMSRQIERLERGVTITAEAFALFIRFWLATTAPAPDAGQASAQARGRARYENFVGSLGRRLAHGRTLFEEVSEDIAAQGPSSQEAEPD